MKKLLFLVIFIVLVIVGYIILVNKPKDYEITYKINKYEIVEKYDKSDEVYYFTLIDNKDEYNYVIYKNYTSSRKIVKDIKLKEKDGAKCFSLVIKGQKELYTCMKDNVYMDPFVSGIEKGDEEKQVKTYKKISIYNDNYNYYIWNGYGITDILNKKEYKFLKKESYDNLLSYKLGDKIIFADYNQSREFNKFFIFDSENKKIDTWDLDIKISFNSYFMGDVDNYIYLFDKKKKVQYKLDIDKYKYTITSDSYGGVFFDKEWTNVTYNSLVYNEKKFNMNPVINYFVNSEKLYYKIKYSENKVLSSNKKIDSVIYVDNNAIYYLAEDDLYRYSILKGEEKLLTNFEWNFSSKNKIFIFD